MTVCQNLHGLFLKAVQSTTVKVRPQSMAVDKKTEARYLWHTTSVTSFSTKIIHLGQYIMAIMMV